MLLLVNTYAGIMYVCQDLGQTIQSSKYQSLWLQAQKSQEAFNTDKIQLMMKLANDRACLVA